MLRRRTVLTAGLGLLGACDQRPAGDQRPAPVDSATAPGAPRDLVALALADRARTIHDAPPPSATASTPLLFAADLGSARTWDSHSLAVHADGRACLRRIRTAVTTTLARDELDRLDIPMAEFTGDARSRYTDGNRHGRPRTFHGHARQIAIVGDPAHLPPALHALDAEVSRLVDRIAATTSTTDDRLLVWHAREHLAVHGAFDDELWVFADGHLLLRRAEGTAIPTFTTRRVTPAALAFLTVALDRPIAPTDTLKPVALALGTGHKFVLASIGRELAVQPGEAPSDGLGPVLRETEWLRGGFP